MVGKLLTNYTANIFLVLVVIFLSYSLPKSFAINENSPISLQYDSSSQEIAHFFNVDVFSDLSRNMTTSSSFSTDLFSNDTFSGADGTAGNIEREQEEEEAMTDSNETSISESQQSQSTSDLFDEENGATEGGQIQEESIQSEVDVGPEQDESPIISEGLTQGENEKQSSNPINEPGNSTKTQE